MAETFECKFSNPRSPIEKEIAILSPWFHNLHLPEGEQTAPEHRLGDFPYCNWSAIQDFLPEDMSSMTALDIGCNAGFYSFELAKRGAHVTAIDSDEHYLKQAKWAMEKYGLEDKINFKKMDFYDLRDSEVSFDIVLFMGVFYHLRYPLLGLDIAAGLTKKYMAFQTLILPGNDVIFDTPYDLDYDDRNILNDPKWPRMAFVENRLAGDPTNWWIPNPAAVEATLRSSGLEIQQKICREFYLCTPGRKPDLRFPLFRK